MSVAKIPKLVWQTWKNDQVPDKWKRSPESIAEFIPDWTYQLMTDEMNREFIAQHRPDFLPYYDAFPYAIQRADAIRYVKLFVDGGLYMDLDFEVQKPLDPLFKDDAECYLVASGNVGSCLTNSFMASKPGCQLWNEVIEEMKKPPSSWWIGKHLLVMNTTGPLMLNRVARRWNGTYVMLPSSQLMPCSVCDEVCTATGAYVRNLPGCSWVAFDSRMYNFFLCKWRDLLSVVLIILLGVLVLYMMNRM